MIPAGQYRHKATIQSLTETAATGGGATATWATYATIRCAIVQGSGSERVEAAQVEASAGIEVRTRYQSGITTKMRVVWGDRTFEINSVENVNGLGREMRLSCTERPS